MSTTNRNEDFIALTQRVTKLLERDGLKVTLEPNETSITTTIPRATWFCCTAGKTLSYTMVASYDARGRLRDITINDHSITHRNGPMPSCPLHRWTDRELDRKVESKLFDLLRAERPRRRNSRMALAA